jgi:hypothetical protein
LNHRPTDFRLWLRDQLYADTTNRPDVSADRAAPSRMVQLSELEAFALMLLAFDLQTEPSADSYTQDIAHYLTSALRSRLAREP